MHRMGHSYDTTPGGKSNAYVLFIAFLKHEAAEAIGGFVFLVQEDEQKE